MRGARASAILLLCASLGCARRSDVLRIEMRSVQDRAHLAEGWSGFETADGSPPLSYCWVEGTSARVSVGSAPRTGTAHLRVTAWPLAHAGLSDQRMRLWANGLFIDERTMGPEPADYAWAFPARLLQIGGNEIRLVFDRANRPIDVLPGRTDTRRLSAAVALVELTYGP